MARIKSKINPGEKVVGRVTELEDDQVTLEGKDGKKTILKIPPEISVYLESYTDSIVTIQMDGDDFDIEDHENWPQ